MRDENIALREEVKTLKYQITEMLSKKNSENEALSLTNARTDQKVEELENRLMNIEAEKIQAIEECDGLRQDLKKQQDEMKKKVNQLAQVNNMKKMIMDKNNQMKALRERLQKYENIDDD